MIPRNWDITLLIGNIVVSKYVVLFHTMVIKNIFTGKAEQFNTLVAMQLQTSTCDSQY